MFQSAFWLSEEIKKAETKTAVTGFNGQFCASEGFWMETLWIPTDFSRFQVKHERQELVTKLSLLALLSIIMV